MKNKTRLNQLISRLQNLDSVDAEVLKRLEILLDDQKRRAGQVSDTRLKIAMFDAKSYDLDSFNRENSQQYSIHPLDCALDEHTAGLAKGCPVVCIFVNDKCDALTVEALASNGVKLIALRCAGYNNVDLASCQEHNIDVVRVPAYSPHAVAEHTVALMLMLNRKLHRAYMRNHSGQFILEGLVGFDMYGKTVGVIGTGKIGRCVIDILSGFGCHILAFDNFPDDELQSRGNVRYTSMQELQQSADIITLHVPLSPDTYYLIDEAAISEMKKGVMLINTSRGALVNTKALINGLKSEKIGFAGLDVYEEEAEIFFHDISDEVLTDDVFARLLTFNNVVITSHQAFLTQEALSNIARTTLDNIAEFNAGKRERQLTNKVFIDT